MKKFIVVMIMIVCILFIANASWAAWQGWAKFPDGTHAPKYTHVIARGEGTPDVITSYTGRGYWLSAHNGMIPGKTYWIVDATANGHYGFAYGGIYQNSPWLTKNITLNDAIANPR